MSFDISKVVYKLSSYVEKGSLFLNLIVLFVFNSVFDFVIQL